MVFLWKAIYNDNTFYESSDTPGAKDYDKIDRSKLSAFEIFDSDTKKLIYRLVLEPGQRLIYRKRGWQDFYTSEKLLEIYMVGWQQTVNGRNIQSISHIFPDGHVEQSGKWVSFERENNSIKYDDETGPPLRDDEK